MRKDARGMTIKDDYLARLLSLRWAPELSAYDALYKMAATLVRKSNAFAAVMYNEDFTKVKQIVPLTVSSFRIYEDDDGNILFRFTWDYDGKTYVLPYQSVIHIRARFSKKRFIGTPPDQAIQTTLELLNATGQALKNTVKNSANLKGYLKYNNFADEDELKKKVQEFQAAYMSAENDGGIGGLDNTMEFHEITQRTPNIPTIQSQYLRDNLCSRRQNLPDRAGNLQSRAAGRQPVNYPENLRSGPHTDNGNVELHHLRQKRFRSRWRLCWRVCI